MSRKSSSEKNPDNLMTRAECRAISGKLELALFGKDGRGGMVKDIGDIRSDQRIIKKSLKSIQKHRESQKVEEKEKKRDWRGLIYSVIGGAIVAAISWILSSL